nr:transposase [Roseibium album]
MEAQSTIFEAGRQHFFGDIADLTGPATVACLLTAVSRRDWGVNAKPPFGGPEQVLAYLRRYTYRIAIANSRMVDMEDGKATFRWREYCHGRRTKLMTREADEFNRRFLLHMLPDGFHRIRHYSFLANAQHAARLASRRLLLATRVHETAFLARARDIHGTLRTPVSLLRQPHGHACRAVS